VLSAAAIGSLEPSLLLYPVYYCLVNGGLALLIGVRRAAARRQRDADCHDPDHPGSRDCGLGAPVASIAPWLPR
jgi:hypothetical protein